MCFAVEMRQIYALLIVLLALAGCGGGRYGEMRQRLEALNALNRADSVLTATERDEAQALADYFDSHGTPNDQLLAHYLLGRCYADMHEAPMALHCYQEAISRADTLSPDCDFAQLSRVYGQSATIFYQQGLYRNQLEYEDLASSYAWRENDTLAALQRGNARLHHPAVGNAAYAAAQTGRYELRLRIRRASHGRYVPPIHPI